MAPTSTEKPKRTANACTRCRSRKVKCSGTYPCTNCEKRKVFCVFEDDRRILVSEHEFLEMKKKLALLSSPSQHEVDSPRVKRRRLDAGSAAPMAETAETGPSTPASVEEDVSAVQTDEDESFQKNPLVSNPSTFVRYTGSRKGRPWIFLGPTSSWTFSRRVLDMTHQQLRPADPIEIPLPVDGDAYRVTWSPVRADETADISGLPSLDYSLYLMNTVKFHLGQTLRLFDEEEFSRNLYEFYEDAEAKLAQSRLWYVQFLLVLAFGKAFLVSTKSNSNAPAGAEYFSRAMSLIPDTPEMWHESILAIEVLAMTALYLYSIDMRDSAYCYIGHAMRMALMDGLHRAIAVEQLGEKLTERCSNIWWTVYILDQQFSSLMGAPVSVRESDITATFHNHRDSTQRAAALTLNVKISRVIAEVSNTVYSVDGRLDGHFLKRTGRMLRRLADLARELEDVFQNKFKSSVDTLSGVTTRLNLSYHSCIIVATRPLILILLHDRLESFNRAKRTRTLSAPVRRLIQACTDSAVKSLKILAALREHRVLENFLPFNLENAFSSAFVLGVIDAILPGLVPDQGYVELTNEILDEMISRGNKVAKIRKNELELLMKLLLPLHNYNTGVVQSQIATSNQHGPNQPFDSNIDTHSTQEEPSGRPFIDATNTLPVSPSSLEPSFPVAASDGNGIVIDDGLDADTPFAWHELGASVGLSPLQMLSMAEQLDVTTIMAEGGTDVIAQDEWLWDDRLR